MYVCIHTYIYIYVYLLIPCKAESTDPKPVLYLDGLLPSCSSALSRQSLLPSCISPPNCRIICSIYEPAPLLQGHQACSRSPPNRCRHRGRSAHIRPPCRLQSSGRPPPNLIRSSHP